jgi:hypothetical protein
LLSIGSGTFGALNEIEIVERQLERRQPVAAAVVLGDELIERRGRRSGARCRAREPTRRRARVVQVRGRVLTIGALEPEPTDHVHAIAERLERFQYGRELELLAAGRSPAVEDRAVRHVERREALRRGRFGGPRDACR